MNRNGLRRHQTVPATRLAPTAVLCLLLTWQGGWSLRVGGQTAEARETVAVLDFVLNLALANADDAGRDQLPVAMATEQMRAQVAKSNAYALATRSPVTPDAVVCSYADDTCAAQIGATHQAQRVIQGRVTKVSALIWYVSVRLIDVQTAALLHTETVQFRGNMADVMPRVIAILWRRLHETD